MASWLKAAEDLFEVVDRRAKLVVGEQSDELPVTTSGSNERASQGTRSRSKTQRKRSAKEAPASVSNLQEQATPETSESHAESDGNISVPSVQNHGSNSFISIGKVDSSERKTVDTESPITDTSISGMISNDAIKSVDGHSIAENSSNVESVASNSNGNLRMEDFADMLVGNPSNSSKFVETGNRKAPVDSNQNMMEENEGSSRNIEFSESQTLNENTPSISNAQSKDVALVTEPGNQGNNNQEQETITEQLDEAQGLLETAISTGQSKEARLARHNNADYPLLRCQKKPLNLKRKFMPHSLESCKTSREFTSWMERIILNGHNLFEQYRKEEERSVISRVQDQVQRILFLKHGTRRIP